MPIIEVDIIVDYRQFWLIDTCDIIEKLLSIIAEIDIFKKVRISTILSDKTDIFQM